ncbi:MAG: protocatechuate 3,4-dioxygenase subunit beta [Marinobacter sp.]|mgnify:CR=1 FL=1|uniref:Protocatechuate 3,4-dioxygenase, beta subunit n=1 Tax=Marinobacter algicola DG893 TaxID=443152 RepID=A6F016_9GAMM|nr:protocatechuate 3,4-dioxygenase subunit beta [Marinobacter algicola]EDM47929.1 protocatechuate 3,4-dioxygenase, beta subunit [Marinobacter algicola DG893]
MSVLSGRDWKSQPPYIDQGYKSTSLRGPSRSLVKIDPELAEMTGPAFGDEVIGSLDHDLTRNGRVNGEPLGERIVVTGRVLDENGQSLPNTLIEVWQANAAGRYIHKKDQHDAPVDPNFLGAGRCMTDDQGRYRFYTIRPGAYPWGNHPNAWRPNHIHFSLFGPTIATRLITQMYFPGDPLLAFDPIFESVPEAARGRLISEFSLDVTEEGFALGYVFDIVLRGTQATPMEGTE